MSKKVVFHYGNSLTGGHETLEFPDDMSDSEICQALEKWALEKVEHWWEDVDE